MGKKRRFLPKADCRFSPLGLHPRASAKNVLPTSAALAPDFCRWQKSCVWLKSPIHATPLCMAFVSCAPCSPAAPSPPCSAGCLVQAGACCSVRRVTQSVTLTGCAADLYAACDGIDAAYDVEIGEDTVLNIYTDKYSPYSGEVTAVSDDCYLSFLF